MTEESQIIELYPKVPCSAINLLWHCDYYDGPLSGMLKTEGADYWFEMIDENDVGDEPYRRFSIIELTSEQLSEERYFHDLFRKFVGTHTDYGKDGRLDGLLPRETWHKFYDEQAKRKERDYSANRIVGWFEI